MRAGSEAVMRYHILVYLLALIWVFRVNLGDLVHYRGKKYSVANGTRCDSWRLYDLDNGDDGWVPRAECRKVLSLRNYIGSFKSGVWFYKTSWLSIWKHSGAKGNIIW